MASSKPKHATMFFEIYLHNKVMLD